MEQNIIEEMNIIDSTYGKYLIVVLGEQFYGIPVANVVQIVGVQEIVSVPEFPYYAKGIINLRGSIIPIIDTRLRLGLEEAQHTDRTCIIITSVHTRSMGFIVDSVDEVTDMPDEKMLPTPHADGRGDSYVNGVCKHEKKIVLRLDMDRMLNNDSFAELYSEES